MVLDTFSDSMLTPLRPENELGLGTPVVMGLGSSVFLLISACCYVIVHNLRSTEDGVVSGLVSLGFSLDGSIEGAKGRMWLPGVPGFLQVMPFFKLIVPVLSWLALFGSVDMLVRSSLFIVAAQGHYLRSYPFVLRRPSPSLRRILSLDESEDADQVLQIHIR
jgi:hypothetical protein